MKNKQVFYCDMREKDKIVYVLARAQDPKGQDFVVFTEIGSGKNVVLPEYLFENNYIPARNFHV